MIPEKYPIVKVDRTTVQEFLPMLMHRGLFSNYRTLPKKEDILEKEKIRLGVSLLTPESERRILAEVGEYRTEKNVIRDLGDYIISFSPKLYLDYLNGTESDLWNDIQNSSEDEEKISKILQQVRLYKLAHKLVLIILSRVYTERKFRQLEISKQDIIERMGFSTNDKHIYNDVSDAILSLMLLNYQVFKYKNKIKIDPRYKAIGNFVYNIREDSKKYILDVNENFVGCVGSLFNERKDNSPEDFARGYLSYPTSVIPMTKEYSTPAMMLTHFLIFEKGNSKLRKKGYKVVGFKVKRFMEVMNISAARPSKRKADFLSALREVGIINGIMPAIADLNKITPAKLEKTVLRITVKSEIKELDSHIKSILLGAKM